MQTMIKTLNVYTYSELTGKAKDKARQWLIDAATDYEWYETTIDDCKETAKLLGIDVDKIYFSGFWSQGDGACFVGRYSYAKGAATKITSEWPKDTELHRIAKALQQAQRLAFYTATANISHSSRYCHSYSMSIDATSDKGANVEDDLQTAFRDFADWIYDRLRSEYEYRTGDENLTEIADINEWFFDENGNRSVVI